MLLTGSRGLGSSNNRPMPVPAGDRNEAKCGIRQKDKTTPRRRCVCDSGELAVGSSRNSRPIESGLRSVPRFRTSARTAMRKLLALTNAKPLPGLGPTGALEAGGWLASELGVAPRTHVKIQISALVPASSLFRQSAFVWCSSTARCC